MTIPLSRRHLLGLAAGSAVAAGLGLRTSRTEARTGAAPTDPDAAFEALMAGNRRFTSGRAEAPHRKLARVHELASGQTPFAAILGCADSRVPAELVFDQGFGDLFVVRVAGNIATPEGIGSLEFGTLVLGARVLLVLGHTSCGAVKAAIEAAPVPGQISSLFQHMVPAIAPGTKDVDATGAANVRLQTRVLLDGSPVIAGLVRDGKLRVAGAVYDLATGVVQPLPA